LGILNHLFKSLHQSAERGGLSSIALNKRGVLLLEGVDRESLPDESKGSLDVRGEVLVGNTGSSSLGVVRVASNVELNLFV